MNRFKPEIKNTYELYGDMEMEFHAVMKEHKRGKYVLVSDVLKRLNEIDSCFGAMDKISLIKETIKDLSYEKTIEINSSQETLHQPKL